VYLENDNVVRYAVCVALNRSRSDAFQNVTGRALVFYTWAPLQA